MRWLHRCAVAVAACAIASSAGILLGFVGELQVEAAVEFCVITFAAILVSTFAIPQSAAEDEAAMPPSFVFMFAALLLFGRNAATLVAAAAAVASGLVRWRLAHPLRRILANTATVVIATFVAASAHQLLAGAMGPLDWPWRGVPIAAAVLVYCIATSASADLILPALAKRPVGRAWPKSPLRGGPSYVIGASLGGVLVEMVNHRAWEVFG